MNRQEAIAELKRMASTIEWDYPLDAQIAIEKAVEALRGPQPDPDTGLVPCGCGGRAMLIGLQAYSYVCIHCGTSTRNYEKEEHAKTAWNTAMGQKGGAE